MKNVHSSSEIKVSGLSEDNSRTRDSVSWALGKRNLASYQPEYRNCNAWSLQATQSVYTRLEHVLKIIGRVDAIHYTHTVQS